MIITSPISQYHYQVRVMGWQSFYKGAYLGGHLSQENVHISLISAPSAHKFPLDTTKGIHALRSFRYQILLYKFLSPL